MICFFIKFQTFTNYSHSQQKNDASFTEDNINTANNGETVLTSQGEFIFVKIRPKDLSKQRLILLKGLQLARTGNDPKNEFLIFCAQIITSTL